MINFNEAELKAAIVEKAADQILCQDDSLSEMIGKEVRTRIDKIFVDRAEVKIQTAIDEAIKGSFDREYQRVSTWGEPVSPKTTIRKELEKTIDGYWSAKVDNKTGKPSTSDYSSVTRAEYLMTTICADDFSATMKQHAQNIAGALKDGLRAQMAKQMDGMLDGLFHIKSLQDQGKVDKPW